MRTEFNKLANVLERYDLTEYGDELDIALKNLKDKVFEKFIVKPESTVNDLITKPKEF